MTGEQRRAAVIGVGLIGGSIGLGLRAHGWHVTGRDSDFEREAMALDVGALDIVGEDRDAEVTFVATPVGEIVDEVQRALERTQGIVTDAGSVKGPIVDQVRDPRFIGGHPMSGSEQVGLSGARTDLFEGAAWVLTPDEATADSAFVDLRGIITTLGAQVLSIPAHRHDALVAVVSHVPHLAAASLMQLAAERSRDQGALLRLAAGGFRDMTRVASGHPGIWPDICSENSSAITDTLDEFIRDLTKVRDLVEGHDRPALMNFLESARSARRSLPTGVGDVADFCVVRVPVPDRAGVLAEITRMATDLNINIADIEIGHSAEGSQGVLILVIDKGGGPHFQEALADAGYRSSVRPLE